MSVSAFGKNEAAFLATGNRLVRGELFYNRAMIVRLIYSAIVLASLWVTSDTSTGSSVVVRADEGRTVAQRFACPITRMNAADDPAYYNGDRSISIVDTRGWRAGVQGVKVPWMRPIGKSLVVTGHRLDSDDPGALKADVPCCYNSYFQASRLYFPSGGCWEITATAGTSELRFVTEVPTE